ncbi:MAG TPA: class I SAM-dependent methyltransferase [Polyangiaceae bacterium]
MRRAALLPMSLFIAGCSRADPTDMAGPSPARSSNVAIRDAAPGGPARCDSADPVERRACLRWDAIGQPDIVYVPTPQAIVDRMLGVARVQKADLLYDLGCGDGRIVVTAARRYGAHAVGFDIDPERVTEARANVRAAGVEDLVTIRWADITMVDLSPAQVVTMYLSPRVEQWLMQSLQKLAPGSRIVTHDYKLPDVMPVGRWSLQGPFFGRSNELYEAGVPEDPAHYQFTEHRIFFYVTPLEFPKE